MDTVTYPICPKVTVHKPYKTTYTSSVYFICCVCHQNILHNEKRVIMGNNTAHLKCCSIV